MSKLEQKLLRRLIRCCCDAVLTMDKLAGYGEVELQNKLINRYKIYFDLDLSSEQILFANSVMENRIKEEHKNAKTTFFLYRCKNIWFGGK